MKSNLKKFNTLGKRVVTALAGSIAIIGGIYWNMWSFFIVFSIINFLTLWEFYRLINIRGKVPFKVYGLTVGFILFTLFFLVGADIIPSKYLMVLFPLFATIFLINIYKKGKNSFLEIGYTFLGIIYVSLPFSLLNVLVFTLGQYHFEIIFALLFILWANDVGAYFIGTLFGKNKLFPRISPKKTWEGCIGGAVFALSFVYGFSIYFNSLSILQWFLLAILIIVTGIYGDLVESLFKRSIDVKDSGNAIPGHGGFLDRFDGLLLASPFTSLFINVI